MLTLYHAATTRSFRIRWLLDELGADYEMKTLNFYTDDRNTPEFRAISPMGSIPVITEGNFALIESGAIINYILEHHSDGRFSFPKSSREAALVDQWMWWAESLFAIYQRVYWDHCAPFPAGREHPVPKLGEDAKEAALRYARMLEDALGEDGFIMGERLTGADFMLCFPLYLAWLENWFTDHPKIKAYVERLVARPKFANAVADTLAVVAEFEAMKTR